MAMAKRAIGNHDIAFLLKVKLGPGLRRGDGRIKFFE
jgi:hypothetical protein